MSALKEIGEVITQMTTHKLPRKQPRKIMDIYRTYRTYKSVYVPQRSIMNPEYKPQMNADERRLIAAVHRKGRKERKAAQQEPLHSCVKKIRYGINNELERTDTNSGYSDFVQVRISSLLISVLRLLYDTAHERAPPALRPRLSRAGGNIFVWRDNI